MCGIAAVVEPTTPVTDAALRAMCHAIRHRGPDGEGYVVLDDTSATALAGPDTPRLLGHSLPFSPAGAGGATGWAALGHRRLAIIDLSPTGHQPMSTSDRRRWITYNGEVYNFIEIRAELESLGRRFLGTSDTEVILAAHDEWGDEAPSRFVGMFAYVIIDAENRMVTAVRDRFGVKPLYYWRTPTGGIAFASEIKQFCVLDGWSPTADALMLHDFLAFGMHDHTTRTMFDRVHQVPPGGALRFRATTDGIRAASPRRWWWLRPEEFEGSFGEAVEEFGRRFGDAVAVHLRSDVAVGSCLSGGLDSSSIVCEANRVLRAEGDDFSQLAFTATSDEPSVDESRWVDLVVDATGVTSVRATPDLAALPDLLPELARTMDEPFGSTSILAQWTVFGLAAEHRTKVLLDGQGADEQLAGYLPYIASRVRELIGHGDVRGAWREARATRARYPDQWRTLLQMSAFLSLPQSAAETAARRVGASGYRAGDWLDLPALGVDGVRDPARMAGGRGRSVRELSVAQLTATNLPMLLHYEDRDSMAHSVEARVPFLDHRLVEFTVGLPSSFLLRLGTTKRVMRASMRGTVPDEILDRPDKIGFQTAERRWMTETHRSDSQRLAHAAAERLAPVLRPGAAARASAMIDGHAPLDGSVWRLISAGAWTEAFDVKVGA